MRPPAFFAQKATFWQWFWLGYLIAGCIFLPPAAAYILYLLLA